MLSSILLRQSATHGDTSIQQLYLHMSTFLVASVYDISTFLDHSRNDDAELLDTSFRKQGSEHISIGLVPPRVNHGEQ